MTVDARCPCCGSIPCDDRCGEAAPRAVVAGLAVATGLLGLVLWSCARPTPPPALDLCYPPLEAVFESAEARDDAWAVSCPVSWREVPLDADEGLDARR